MKRRKHTVLEIKNLIPETFILRLDRQDFQFEPGQYVVLRMPHEQKGREYSIFSATTDDYLYFLIREIPEGEFSRYLRHLKPGSEIDVEGPKGYFVLDERSKKGAPILMIASGTGISPFHSYVKSYPNLNYKVLHGVRFANEAYGRDAFSPDKYLICSSRRDDGGYFGRVTYYLKETTVDKDTICYLCGNSEMIDQATTILEKYGLPPENIRTEVFF
jgi:ferredoxin--NADP+ reductase